jgi:hypothetical protein
VGNPPTAPAPNLFQAFVNVGLDPTSVTLPAPGTLSVAVSVVSSTAPTASAAATSPALLPVTVISSGPTGSSTPRTDVSLTDLLALPPPPPAKAAQTAAAADPGSPGPRYVAFRTDGVAAPSALVVSDLPPVSGEVSEVRYDRALAHESASVASRQGTAARAVRTWAVLPGEEFVNGEEHFEGGDPFTEVSTYALSTVVATAGYVLLNTRTGYWLLSLLTARPLWQQLDPLEVLYAWEKERGALGADGDEEKKSLLDLVQDSAPAAQEKPS